MFMAHKPKLRLDDSMSNTVEKELKLFKEKLPSLLKSNSGQWIAMKDGEVLHSNVDKNAVIDAILGDGFSFGEFLLKQVTPEDDAVHRFFSRVG